MSNRKEKRQSNYSTCCSCGRPLNKRDFQDNEGLCSVCAAGFPV